MKRVGVPSSSNGNAEGTIGDQNLVVTRNNANTNAFDELLTDLEVKLDLFCVEVEQIKNHFLKLKVQQESMESELANNSNIILDNVLEAVNRNNYPLTNGQQNGKDMATDVDKSE